MNILVCIKQVPDDSVFIGLNPETGLPATDHITPVVNAFDTYALEMAVRCKEQNGGEVTVLSVGGSTVKESLKNCLAVGADHAFVAELPYTETKQVREAILQSIRQREEAQGAAFDLIFFGMESTDLSGGEVGTWLAEHLHRGLIPSAIDLEVADRRVTVKKETEVGYCLFETNLPAVLTVSKPAYDPRYPSIKSKLAARKAVIEEIPIHAEPDACEAVVLCAMREPEKRKAGSVISGDIQEKILPELMVELQKSGVL